MSSTSTSVSCVNVTFIFLLPNPLEFVIGVFFLIFFASSGSVLTIFVPRRQRYVCDRNNASVERMTMATTNKMRAYNTSHGVWIIPSSDRIFSFPPSLTSVHENEAHHSLGHGG